MPDFSKETMLKLRDAVIHFTDEVADIADKGGVDFGRLLLKGIEYMVKAFTICMDNAEKEEEKNED